MEGDENIIMGLQRGWLLLDTHPVIQLDQLEDGKLASGHDPQWSVAVAAVRDGHR